LRHWLEDETEVIEILEKLPDIQREAICRRA
jgi:hypothetical protein